MQILKDRCQELNDKYLKIKIPKAELTDLLYELTERFEQRMEFHDSLIEHECHVEIRAVLIERAKEELTETLDRLAAAIRARPSVSRRLRYGSSDSSSEQ